MTSDDPPHDMKIGEIVKRSGLTERMLRHYEALGIIQPKRSGGGTRYYSEQDLAVARLAKLLREVELPLETMSGLAVERRQHATGDAASGAVAALLDAIAQNLAERAARSLALQATALEAAAAVRKCQGCDNPPSPTGCPDCPLHDEVGRNAVAALIWRDP